MPEFDPGRLYDGKSYEKAIIKAREDLEKDYPGCSVFIHYRQGGKVKVIRQDPRVSGRFEIKAHTCSLERMDTTTTFWPKDFSRMMAAPSKPFTLLLLDPLLKHIPRPDHSTVSNGTVVDTFQNTTYFSMARRDGNP
jgi:hypothetical protein